MKRRLYVAWTGAALSLVEFCQVISKLQRPVTEFHAVHGCIHTYNEVRCSPKYIASPPLKETFLTSSNFALLLQQKYFPSSHGMFVQRKHLAVSGLVPVFLTFPVL